MAELEVVIDGRGAVKGASVVVRSLDGITKKAGQTDRALKKTSGSLRKVGRTGLTTGRVLGGIGAFLVAKKVVQYADAWTQLNNRLKLVTKGQDELNAVTEEVFQIAQRTRSGLESTADLYARIARSSDTLGLSQNDLLGVTESVAQAITISGTAADSANAAIIQLGQGLASGTLRGDELRSVLEQTPRLARAIADGMDLPIGALREMGKQGKLTGAAVVKALQDQKEVLEKEFAQTSATVAQSFVILENAVIKSVGAFSDASGAAGGFAGIIIDLAEFIEKDFTPGLLEFGDQLAIAFEAIGDGADDSARRFEAMGIDITSVTGFIGDALVEIPTNLVNAFGIITTELGGLFAFAQTGFESFINDNKTLFATLIGDEEALEETTRKRLELFAQVEGLGAELDAERIRNGDAIISQEQRLQAAIDDRAAARARANAADLDQKAKVEAGLVANPEQLKDAAKLLKSLETDQEKFNRTIEEAGVLLKAGALDQEEYNKVIVRTSEAYSETLPEVEAYNDAVEEAAQLTEDLQTPQEKHAANVENIDNLMKQNLITWETFGRAIEDSAEEMRAADPAYLTQEERLAKIQELLADVATPQEEYNAKLAELASLQDDMDPEDYTRLKDAAKAAFEEAALAADPLLSKLVQLGETAAQSIESAFSDFLLDPTAEGFEDMADSFSKALQRMAADAITAQIFQSLFGGAAGAAGGGGGLGGLLGGALTSFAAADGGTFPGGQPVLVGEEGPEIITPRSQSTIIPNDKSSAMMSQAPPIVNVTPQIINVSDPQAAVAAMESTGGQQAIMNAISQNPDAIKRALS